MTLNAVIVKKGRKYQGRLITCYGRIRPGNVAVIGYFKNGKPVIVQGIIEKISWSTALFNIVWTLNSAIFLAVL